jgi:hypothetical protein
MLFFIPIDYLALSIFLHQIFKDSKAVGPNPGNGIVACSKGDEDYNCTANLLFVA